ncbi:MAG: RIP metalloprotease RseP [Clostridia bacterium]
MISILQTIGTIILFLVVLCILVFVHELGHFVSAKLSGVKVNEFSIGMGFCFFKKQIGETQYSLRILPIGGYVKMEGDEEESDDPRAFNNAAKWKRFLIFLNGALMNFILGFFIMLALTATSKAIPSQTVGGFIENSTSNSSGLQVNDEIIKINNSKVNTYSDISYGLALSGNKQIDLTVKRNNEIVNIDNVQFPSEEIEGTKMMYIDFKVYKADKTFLNVIKYGFYDTLSVVKTVWVSFVSLIGGKVSVSQMSGPVGIGQAVGQAASNGFPSLLMLIAFISVNLGVVNLLPLPALDGGHIVFLAIETVIGKPVPPKYENIIHLVGFGLLMLFAIFITYNDIVRIFFK